MISLESVNGKKGLGLEFGAGNAMEGTELEEGEACYFHNDDDSTIDPDVALSHIDEKLQYVLGHLQKDFEGEVTAENLGAKFGAYGSFLPTYQRSPAWSHPKTPPKVHNNSISRTPSNLHLEGGSHGSKVQSNASLPVRSGPASVNAPSQPVPRASSSMNDALKRYACLSSTDQIEPPTSRGEVSDKSSDQKTLKVRIKMGCDNSSTQKNAELYSGLGLDVSPSSSLGDSPLNSEGSYPDHHHVPDESPTSILQIMTSFPVLGSLLLSPLPDDVMCLTEKTKLYKGSHGSTDYVRGDKKVLAENKRKSFDKSSLSGETKKNQNGNDSRAKKEIGNDLLSCEELVSNALKLPLLSSSYSDADSAKAAKTEVDNFNGFSKVAEKISETKKENSLHPRKEGNHNVEKADKLSKSAQNDSKGRAPLDIELTDAPPMQKASHKATPFKEYGLEMAKENSSSSGGRKKSKEGQRHGAQGLEVLKNCSSKSRKGVHAKNHMSRGESKDSRKDHGKTKDRYSDIFGDLEFEHGDDDIISEEMPFEDRPNESEVVVKSKLDLNGSSKERLNGSKVDRPPALDAYQRAASNMAPLGENRAMTAEGHATVGPLVKEDWVCCDKCQKWRLLPFGMNPESLPEKWLCSMLNWLPGMNRCNFSEDETTNALVAHYRVSAPAPVHALAPAPAPAPASHMGEVSLGEQAVAPLFGHDNPSFALDSVPSSVKKKNGLKDLPNASNRDGLTHSSNLQAPLKTKGLNLVNQSSSGSEFEFPHFDKSSSFHKQKEKNTQLEKSSDGGDAKSSKMRNKRDTDRDSLRASKKMKAASMNSTGEDRISDHGGTVLKAGHSSSSGLSIKGSGKDRRKHSDHSKLAAKNNSQDSVRCSEEQIQMPTENGSLGMKRKVNEFQDNEISNMTPARPGSLRLQDDHRKEKRAKVSKSEGKESVLSKSNGAIIHPSLAATSSSSKISGSRKSKTKETKGSPVESVSSSPLRILNPDKFTSSTTNLGGKDDYQDDDSFAPSSSLRCSDGDHGRGSARSEKVKMDENSKVMHNGSLELVENSKFATHHTNGDVDTINRGSQQPSNECRDEERGNNSKQSHSNGSRPKKSGKVSSSRTKDKIRSFVSEDEGKARDEKSHAERSKFQEENGVNSDKFDKKIASKKHSTGKLSSENAKQEHQSKLGGHVQKDNPLLNHDGERPSKGSFAEQADKVEVTERPKSHSLPPSGKGQSETGTRRQNGANSLSLDGSEDGIAFKKQIKKVENQNGGHPVSSRHPTPNKHKVRDTDAPSPLRKDGSSQAATNAVKEGKDLKHLADRLKNSESSLESTGIYFQAALKFLHGASLLESSNSENTKHGEMIQSMQMYSSTAKLCEFCAHEYEKSKDMASAALAYKCMEVAYMRVIYSTHTNASRDRNELQTALQIIPPGESPSSSASDIDNLNNPATTEKASLVKGVTSPQVVGNHVIAARNRSGFVRLLNFTQDVNFAMEASRKSRIALAAINPRLEETQEGSGSGGGISSVRTALDFNFQDVEGLLRLVRLAMEAISR